MTADSLGEGFPAARITQHAIVRATIAVEHALHRLFWTEITGGNVHEAKCPTISADAIIGTKAVTGSIAVPTVLTGEASATSAIAAQAVGIPQANPGRSAALARAATVDISLGAVLDLIRARRAGWWWRDWRG